MNRIDRFAFQRVAARRASVRGVAEPGWIFGAAAVAAVVVATMVMETAHGSDRPAHPQAVAAPAERLPQAVAGARDPAPTATLYAPVDFDQLEREPDPSPRSVAAYDH